MKMLAVNGGAFEWQHVRKWAWLQLFIIVAGALAPAATHPCAFVTDAEQKTVPAVPKPGYLASYVDPVFGQRVTRVTGDPATPVPVVGGTWGTRERHRYSSYAAWNADGSLLLISRHNGDHENLYLDGRTYEVLFERDHGPVGEDDRWHPTDPDLLVYVDDHEIGTWNVRTRAFNRIEVFPGYSAFSLSNPANDGSRLAIRATDPSGRPVAFAYDLRARQKTPDIVLSEWAYIGGLDISPLGTYIVVRGRIGETSDGRGDRVQVYNLQGQKVGPYWQDYHRPGHCDLTVDENGDEVAVGNSKSGPDDGRILKRRLRDGAITVLTPAEGGSHTSTRNILKRQWAYTTVGSNPNGPYRNEILAIRLDGGEVRRLASTYRVAADYYAESHGSVSPDGSRVVFASNWGDPLGAIQAYVVEICAASASTTSTTTSTTSTTVVDPCPGDGCVADVVVLDARFDGDQGTFAYRDDAFRGTANPGSADGTFEPSGGRTGGAVRVVLGPRSTAMSGGWRSEFHVPGPSTLVKVDVAYRLIMDGTYEADEFGEALLSVDGALVGVTPADHLVRFAGDGDTPPDDMDSGWRTQTFYLVLSAGTPHEITLGGFNNKSTSRFEITELLFDDVRVTALGVATTITSSKTVTPTTTTLATASPPSTTTTLKPPGCMPSGSPCAAHGDCCSGRCRPRGSRGTCRG